MTIAEKKLRLSKQIMEADDEVLLSELDNILSNSSRHFADDFIDEEIDQIKKGIREKEEGKVVSWEEGMARLKK